MYHLWKYTITLSAIVLSHGSLVKKGIYVVDLKLEFLETNTVLALHSYLTDLSFVNKNEAFLQ